MLRGFAGWEDADECQWIASADAAAKRNMVYINMQLNQEGYTGYEGEEAHRIWRAIYQQNCFNAAVTSVAEVTNHGAAVMQPAATKPFDAPVPPSSAAATAAAVAVESGVMQPVPAAAFDSMCFEQRVFYRLISGLHASISAHISNAFPVGEVDPNVDLHAAENCGLVGADLAQFNRRLGHHPDRLTNLYFAFVFMLRAVNKASDSLRSYNYTQGNGQPDLQLSALMADTLDSSLVKQCSADASFDELSMFNSQQGPHLKRQLRAAFRNISRIIDCVGCEQCKLHGKLQILGLGTALRILFEDSPQALMLERNEVMALVVTLAKFSHALQVVHRMQEQERLALAGPAQRILGLPATMPLAIAVLLGAAIAAVAYLLACVRNRDKDRKGAALGLKAEKIVKASSSASRSENGSGKGEPNTSTARIRPAAVVSTTDM